MATQMTLQTDGTTFQFNDAIPVPVSPGNFDFTVTSAMNGTTVYPATGFNAQLANAASNPPGFYRNGSRQPQASYTYNPSGSITLVGSTFLTGEILSFDGLNNQL